MEAETLGGLALASVLVEPVAPELLLACGAMAMLIIGVYTRASASGLITGLALVVFAAAGLLLLMLPGDARAPTDSFVLDGLARYAKVLLLIGSGVTLVMAAPVRAAEGLDKFEYPVLVVLATLGMMLMVSANDLLLLYLGLELQSLALYVLAAMKRDSRRAVEAGLKYFVLGAMSSGMLLYGASIVYGYTGSVAFVTIADVVSGPMPGLGLVFGMVFLLAGLVFKISAVPFHMWTPDVYEGAPTPVTAFFAAAPKIAALVLLTRVVMGALLPISDSWQQILVFVSIGSMGLGAFAAIGQKNIKRLMAYSSIGHMGYALVGLAAGSKAGVEGVLFYATIYLAMTIGVFACIIAMRNDDGAIEDIDALAGQSRDKPFMAFILAMLMFSLAGIPPLGGFFAKYYVFRAAIEAQLVALAVIGVLASVVSAFYYLRIVKLLYIDENQVVLDPMPTGLRVVLGGAGIFVIAFVLFIRPLEGVISSAATIFF